MTHELWFFKSSLKLSQKMQKIVELGIHKESYSLRCSWSIRFRKDSKHTQTGLNGNPKLCFIFPITVRTLEDDAFLSSAPRVQSSRRHSRKKLKPLHSPSHTPSSDLINNPSHPPKEHYSQHDHSKI